MLPSLVLLRRLILPVTVHDAVCRATTQPAYIEPLVKQLTDLRKTSLAMLFAILGLYLQANRIVAAGWVTALILLVSNICSMYDGLDSETFQAHVNAVGPFIFTLINTLPGFAVTILLCREMVLNSESPAASALQVLLALSPGLLQVLGEALLLYHEPSVLTPTTAGDGDEVSSA